MTGSQINDPQNPLTLTNGQCSEIAIMSQHNPTLSQGHTKNLSVAFSGETPFYNTCNIQSPNAEPFYHLRSDIFVRQ